MVTKFDAIHVWVPVTVPDQCGQVKFIKDHSCVPYQVGKVADHLHPCMRNAGHEGLHHCACDEEWDDSECHCEQEEQVPA